jgi:hypothetical protein
MSWGTVVCKFKRNHERWSNNVHWESYLDDLNAKWKLILKTKESLKIQLSLQLTFTNWLTVQSWKVYPQILQTHGVSFAFGKKPTNTIHYFTNWTQSNDMFLISTTTDEPNLR